MGRLHIVAVVLFSVLASGGACAQHEGRTIRLATLEWPPYTSRNIAHEGESTAIVRAALAAVGYRLEVEFFPWTRAVALTRKPSRFDGYFPEYHSAAIAQRCLLSDSVGASPVGFAQRVEQPVAWQSLDDLARYRIGVVQDYVNSAEFDLRVAHGRQPIDLARDDAQNLRKLDAGRITLALIDERVFYFLMRHDPQLRSTRHQLAFNARTLETKQLHICFRHSNRGEQLRDLVNAGLAKLNSSKAR